MAILALALCGAAPLGLGAEDGATPAQSDAAPSVPTRSPDDFRDIIDRAKARNFPALVFVKPIIEEFRSGEKKKQQVFGSGVVISPDGLVITNRHVVKGAVKVTCVLYDKAHVTAEVLGEDPETDLALLRLDLPEDKKPHPYSVFSDSDTLQAGDFVMALGSPFGFARSISLGIVSNTERYLGFGNQHQYNLWIQTDAAINPGNSGGPLIDTQGGIVGINTMGIFMADNVGFAIPSNIVREVAAQLEADGKVLRAWTGLRLQPLEDFFTNTFTDAEHGVLIENVEARSPAENGGVQAGDILVSVGGVPIEGRYAEDLPAIYRLLANLPVGVGTTFQIQVGGEAREVFFAPTLKGKVEGDDFDCRRWNMTVKEINRHADSGLYFYKKQGVYIQGVRRPGNAGDAGLARRDIVVSMDRKPVETLADLQEIYEAALNDKGREKKVLFEILRRGYTKWIVLDYTKDYEKAD